MYQMVNQLDQMIKNLIRILSTVLASLHYIVNPLFLLSVSHPHRQGNSIITGIDRKS